VNGIARGEVACHVEDRRSGLNTAALVIVWTDEELLALARAVREGAADLTLYEWWNRVGPPDQLRVPEKDGEAELLTGVFGMKITEAESGPEAAKADPSWVRAWTMSLSLEDGFVGMPMYAEDGATLLFAKARTVISHRAGGLHGFGARCPSYQAVRWADRGKRSSSPIPRGTAASTTWTR
jgi:hypothetical protein